MGQLPKNRCDLVAQILRGQMPENWVLLVVAKRSYQKLQLVANKFYAASCSNVKMMVVAVPKCNITSSQNQVPKHLVRLFIKVGSVRKYQRTRHRTNMPASHGLSMVYIQILEISNGSNLWENQKSQRTGPQRPKKECVWPNFGPILTSDSPANLNH